MEQQEQAQKSLLEEDLKHLFERSSVIIFISGRRGSGKTDLGLLLAEILFKLKIIMMMATNIKTFDSPMPLEYITNLQDLDLWLKSAHERKLYILDEAGKAIRRRSPMSHMNLGVLDDLQVIRHFQCSLIMIAPGEQYIDRAALGTDMLDVWIHKPMFKNPKLAVWNDLLEQEVWEIINIPRTSVTYDTHDIAPFTKTSPNKIPKFKDKEREILYKWANRVPIDDPTINKMKLSRLTHDFIKEVLEREVTSNI